MLMTFGESAETNEEKDKVATSKMYDPKYSLPRWCPSELTHSQSINCGT
jgi:hypothetical protein